VRWPRKSQMHVDWNKPMRDAVLGSNTQRNRILNAMSNANLALLQPHLEKVTLKFGQSLQSSNRAIKNVYFPESGIASVVAAANSEARQGRGRHRRP
jgi:hypothetical protein